MNTSQAIERRRTAHSYKKSHIDGDVLRRALELALLAPNHKHSFPWHFVLVGTQTRQKLVDLDLKLRGLAINDAKRADVEARTLNPAALVAFCQKRSDSAFQMREDYATLSCAIQNFSIYLSSEGFETKWSTSKLSTAQETYELLGVDPVHLEIVGFVWVGHADGELPPQRRPSLESCLNILP